MSRVPYASAAESLKYAMICTTPDIYCSSSWYSQLDLSREHCHVVERIQRFKEPQLWHYVLEDQSLL